MVSKLLRHQCIYHSRNSQMITFPCSYRTFLLFFFLHFSYLQCHHQQGDTGEMLSWEGEEIFWPRKVHFVFICLEPRTTKGFIATARNCYLGFDCERVNTIFKQYLLSLFIPFIPAQAVEHLFLEYWQIICFFFKFSVANKMNRLSKMFYIRDFV